MENEQWLGLVTNASPYAIPPGAAVQQINAQTDKPGQMASRGGMVPVNTQSGRVSPTDIHSIVVGEESYLFATTSEGLVLYQTPATGEVEGYAQTPAIEDNEAVSVTNYLLHYYAGGVTEGTETPAPDTTTANVLDGGESATDDYVRCVDANFNHCPEEELMYYDEFYGGSAYTTSWEPAIIVEEICECSTDFSVPVGNNINRVDTFDLVDSDGNTIVDSSGNDLVPQGAFAYNDADVLETNADIEITTEQSAGIIV